MGILELLKEAFPNCWFKEGTEFDGGQAFAWSGEGSTIEGSDAFVYNSYEFDPKEDTYTMGVHNELNDFVEARGYYWESYDAGTYLLYEA